MKKIQVTLLFIVAVSANAKSQNLNFSIGPEYSISTFKGISSNGIGGGVSIGHFFTKRVEGNISLSFNYFNGDVFNFDKTDTVVGFGIMPLLAGIKYFVTKKFYASGAMGMVIGINNAANHFALSPGIGFLYPLSQKSKLDLNVKLVGIPTGYSFSENIFLNKGGYSYLSFRVAYVF